MKINVNLKLLSIFQSLTTTVKFSKLIYKHILIINYHINREDKGQFINLPLLGTLRPLMNKSGVVQTESQRDAVDKNRGDDDEPKEDGDETKGME